ncbi:MAG: DUF1311 domain-containing protein [Bradyrhizobium sp.]|uniref:lysozyme inhibitor LprI family protein n=1 Tax=Bradyrhizobium sp. TaxID=376 RepID=UPI0025C2151A|nr:lysozyme inhibitor LprI family protein [Bradyrhizobium sp.]MBI5262112.1 DUF1311 domain-containing protein [Bradyrhizobium sp.]
MFAANRFSALALAAGCLVPLAASADDFTDFTAANSSASTAIELCGSADDQVPSSLCKEAGYDVLTTQLDTALQAALAKAPTHVRPLLKRDQFWFGEMLNNAVESMARSEQAEDRQAFAEIMRRRVATLEEIAQGFGRNGVTGRWADAFGTVAVMQAGHGTYRLTIDTNAIYGTGSDRQRTCRGTALLKPGPGGWLNGTLVPDNAGPEYAREHVIPHFKAQPAKPPSVKLRRQGETLRVVHDNRDWEADADSSCRYPWQVTGSYFAAGKLDPAIGEMADTPLVTPTFGCTRPHTASDEEICADPDLADNDHRLNRAWKALLPRLDGTTRLALIDDQRSWVKSQAFQYPEFLHPAWEKPISYMHFTTDARDKLDRLQRERIALLENFDENRKGLAGIWLSHTAILNVAPTDDGGLWAEGWKWDQGDWKAGCVFEMKGRLVNGRFRSDEKRTNPDTLERDHAMLIVNRMDDVFAGKRQGKRDTGDDEPKCLRNITISSTVRLFPVRQSPDINNLGGTIR